MQEFNFKTFLLTILNVVGWMSISFAQLPTDIFQNPDNPLENTYWQRTIVNGVGSTIAYFGKDTVFYADDLEDSFVPIDRYSVVGDTFKVQFFGSRLCDMDIIGKYKYTIEEDVLRFLLIEDDCEVREFEVPEEIYTRINYSPPLEEEIQQDSTNKYQFFPNPSQDGIFNYQNNWIERPEYRLYDIHGNLLRTGTIRSSGKLYLSQYEGNIFFLTILGVHGWETYRLLR